MPPATVRQSSTEGTSVASSLRQPTTSNAVAGPPSVIREPHEVASVVDKAQLHLESVEQRFDTEQTPEPPTLPCRDPVESISDSKATVKRVLSCSPTAYHDILVVRMDSGNHEMEAAHQKVSCLFADYHCLRCS